MDFVKLLAICSILFHKSSSFYFKTHNEGKREHRFNSHGTRKTFNNVGMASSVPITNNAAAMLNGFYSKVLQRRPLHMAVIGGSNTAGGGVANERKLHYNIFTNWWNQKLYPITGSHLTAHKIAIGGTGSDFFSFCFQNFLPAQEPDIILIELSLNDYGYKYGKAAQPMELLTRRLLLLPSRPLVMYVNFVDRGLYKDEITNTECNNMEDLGFDKLAEHYGIPSFSWREFVCPLTSSGTRQAMNTEEGMFNHDGSHVSYKAHAEVTSKMIEYFTTQIFPRWASYSRRSAVKKKDYLHSLPAPVFIDKSISDDELDNSMCVSFLTPDWNVPLKHTLSFNVTQSKDFHYVTPAESKKNSVHFKFRTDAYGSWASKTKGALLKIKFLISDGSSRSVVLIYRSKDNRASMKVWLDKDTDSAIAVDSNKCGHHMYQTRLQPIATEVSPGYHTLNVQSNGHGWFEVSGLVVGYPGYDDYEGYRPFDVKAKMWSYENFQKLKC